MTNNKLFYLFLLYCLIVFQSLGEAQPCNSFVTSSGSSSLPCGTSEQSSCNSIDLAFKSCNSSSEIIINISPSTGSSYSVVSSYSISNKTLFLQRTPGTSQLVNVSLSFFGPPFLFAEEPKSLSDRSTVSISGLFFSGISSTQGTFLLNNGALIDLTITDCTFMNYLGTNDTSFGGSIALLAGGSQYSTGETSHITIKNITLSSTYNISPSAFLFSNNSYNSISIRDSTFTNFAGANPGTIIYQSTGTLKMNDITISGSSSINGAVVVDSVVNAEFTNIQMTNSITGIGFQLSGFIDGSLREFINCDFSKNNNTKLVSLIGSSKVTFSQTTFTGNSFAQNGAICITSVNTPVSVDQCSFTDINGLAISLNYTGVYSIASITNSNFIDITGGAISIISGELNGDTLVFENNHAFIGPAIYCELADITINNIEYSNNTQSTVDSFNPVVSCVENWSCTVDSDTDELQESCLPDSGSEKKSGLSKTDKIGIILGCVLGPILVILTCWICIKTKGKVCDGGD